ncbi:tetratricopeptide repeat protein [Leptothoe sp. PORK10 BA2]|uniref:tetratricopeptide repeat protein n=1 Tax=Leptothoe sp. PORK10 BA2 TaxID=3110254 RepID=UPI002B219884|nr:tetratricopeptide repeat protein [Leptothoe sp. PORK10 BA2]MEA5464957.1 tetratricopeptide repeat protein [Leptothoe sp. PORK10 BA2]
MGRRDNRKYGNQGRDQINIERVGGNVLLNSQEAVRPDAEKDLLEAVRRWVESRLEGQLHHAVKLNLQKEAQPQQVRPWGMEVKVAIAQSSQLLPPETGIGQVFDQCLGRLLILGEPGAGKTTSLLDLALELVERAEDDPQQRIPVIVDLSDWQPIVSRLTSRRISIAKQNFLGSASEQVPGWSISNWLTGKVRERYGVPPKQIKQWLKEKRLIPFLDGLDEVSPEYQEDCVRAINLWLDCDWRPRQVAVCCRREPYETYSEKLKLDGAVYLQDLTDEQIQTFLTEANRDELGENLVTDKNLLALIRRPLLLSMAIIAYRELEPIQWQRATSAEDRLNVLLDAYIRHMLTQDILSRACRNRKPPSQKQSRKWLEVLALQLLQDSETDFLIEQIHTTWLSSPFQKILFTVFSITIWSFVFAAVFWGLTFTINFWGSCFNLTNPIRTGSSFRFWFGFGFGSLYGLIRGFNVCKDWLYTKLVVRDKKVSLLTSKLGEILHKLSSWRDAVIPFEVNILIYKLTRFVEQGFNIEDFVFNAEALSMPNQGIKNLSRNVVPIILGFFPMYTMVVGIWRARCSISYTDSTILTSLCMALFLWVLWGGGNICINHFLVRFCLYLTKSTPWDYACFLNYATERLLLQRTGGSYRFVHDLLRQSFAQSRVNSYPHLIHSQVFLQCGRSYRLMKEYNKALLNLNRAIELNPKYVAALEQRGITYSLMRCYEQALQDFNRAIELSPKDDWVIARRGLNYTSMGRYEEALQDFNRAIELNPRNDRVVAWRGGTYILIEQYDEALQDLNRAIKLNPEDNWVIAQRGLNYTLMERYEEALQDFNRAIKIDPEDGWSISNRGYIYTYMERHQEAIQDFNCAIKLKPKNDWYLYLRAVNCFICDQADSAKADLGKAIQIAQEEQTEKPNNHQNTFNLAIYHLVAGNLPTAQEFYQSGLQQGATQTKIRYAIQDLKFLLRVFPKNTAAQQIKVMLEERISEIKFR